MVKFWGHHWRCYHWLLYHGPVAAWCQGGWLERFLALVLLALCGSHYELWVPQHALDDLHECLRVGLGAQRTIRVQLPLSHRCYIYLLLYMIPPGPTCSFRSMVRAVDGMIKEKDAIFVTLISTVSLYQLMAVCCSFLVMSIYCACVASFIIVVGTYYWYTYCLRIYNRFKVNWHSTLLERTDLWSDQTLSFL